jgi:CspA family cold shock protein
MVTDEAGNQFVFTVEMQRKLSEAGLPIEPEYLDQVTENLIVQDTSSFVEEDYSVDDNGFDSEEEKSFSQDTKDQVVAPATIQIDPETGKYIGRVKWYNMRKGYGFLIRGAGEEIFFHKSNSNADPELYQEGQWVLYDVEETRKGPEATEIEPYQGDPSLIELEA